MKTLLTLLTCLFILSPNVVFSEAMRDLRYRDGLWYKKFTQVPFSGKITGKDQGTIINGKREGAWVSYWIAINEPLRSKGNYKNDKREGVWVSYHKNGRLEFKGNYKNGKGEGERVVYNDSGTLMQKGTYRDGKKEGYWVVYLKDGTVDKEYTGTFKNGKKISD